LAFSEPGNKSQYVPDLFAKIWIHISSASAQSNNIMKFLLKDFSKNRKFDLVIIERTLHFFCELLVMYLCKADIA